MDSKKEFLEMLAEACYCINIEFNYERALLLALFVLTQYIDENYKIAHELEIKVVYSALLIYQKALQQIEVTNSQYNIQLLQFKLDQYLKALKLDKNVLTDDKASDIFFQIREQDNQMRQFNKYLSDVLSQEIITNEQIYNLLNQYIDVQKQYQSEKKYSSHLIQQQYVVQALKYVQYFVLNRKTQAEQVYTQLTKLYNICINKMLILIYDIPRMHYIVTILRQNKFLQSNKWSEKYPNKIVNLFQITNIKILSTIQLGNLSINNPAIELWVQTIVSGID